MVDEFLIFTRLLLEKHNDTNRWLNIIQLYSSWCFLTLQKHYHNAKSRVMYPDIACNDANVRASTWSGRGSLTFLTSWSSPFCLWPLHNTSRDINAQNHRHFFFLFFCHPKTLRISYYLNNISDLFQLGLLLFYLFILSVFLFFPSSPIPVKDWVEVVLCWLEFCFFFSQRGEGLGITSC